MTTSFIALALTCSLLTNAAPQRLPQEPYLRVTQTFHFEKPCVPDIGTGICKPDRKKRYTVQNKPIPFYFWKGNKAIQPEKLDGLIVSVLARLPHIPNTKDPRSLLREMALAETRGGYFQTTYRSKCDLGVFQIQEATASCTLQWVKTVHPDVYAALKSLESKDRSLRDNLEYNVAFSCAVAATYYWRAAPGADISTREKRARLWKRVYNTEKGRGTVRHYLANSE